MKQVTMESVKERIARIESGAAAIKPGGMELSLQHEFELACLRELVAVTEQRDAEHGDVLTWEKTMFKVCGEDGHKSVAAKFAELEAQVRLLTEQRDALVAENVGMKSAVPEPRNVEFDNDSMDDVSLAEDFGFNDAVGRMKINMSKTPATDAAIAAMQAEGVEMLVNGLLTESFRMKAAAALADFDGMEEDRLKQIVWSGQPPEPEGCVWDVEYMTRAWVVMKVIKEFARQLRESKGAQS